MRGYVRGVIASDRRELAVVVGLYGAATAAGLVAPRMLGDIVTDVSTARPRAGSTCSP